MVLVGSKAMQWHGLLQRTPRDIDLLTTLRQFNLWYAIHKQDIRSCVFRRNPDRYLVQTDTDKLSFDVDAGSTQDFCHLIPPSPAMFMGKLFVLIPPVTMLMLLKKTHLISPQDWHKHVEDYHVLKARSKPLTEAQEAWYHKRRQETEDRQKGPKPYLNVSNDEFFAKSESVLYRLFVHDDIHKAVAYYTQPLYLRLKNDPDKAMLSEKLFSDLPHSDQLRTVREEAYVIALERAIIPWYKLTKPPEAITLDAYKHALRRLGTNLTRGWFREFVLENYPDLRTPDKDFVGQFHEAVAKGQVRTTQ